MWKKVIWSDESRFTVWSTTKSTRVWRQPEEKYIKECMVPTVKHGGIGVMVWGWFQYDRIGPLVIVQGNLNADGYIGILRDHLIPFLQDFLGEKDAPIFKDNNAAIHWSSKVGEEKQSQGIQSLPWVAQSPDLNPIEHLWDELERRIRGRGSNIKNIKDLKNLLIDEWNGIQLPVVRNLVESMLHRISAVIETKGLPTNINDSMSFKFIYLLQLVNTSNIFNFQMNLLKGGEVTMKNVKSAET
jgi:transposase